MAGSSIPASVTVSKYRWVILIICWMAFVVAYMQRLSIGPLAPFLIENLRISKAQVGLFASASAFGYMLTTIPAGWFVDRFGPRLSLLFGEVFGGIFIILMFTVNSFPMGIAFMALAGLGMGCLSPATTKAVLLWFPVKERAAAMGFKQTAVNVGGIITASALPALALATSWHYGFLSIGVIAFVIGIVSFLLYRQPKEVVSATPAAVTSPAIRRVPLREILNSRDLWLVLFTCFFVAVVEFAAMAYFVLYLQDILLFAVVAAGFFLALVEAGGAFGKPISGIISDRLFGGGRRTIYILMCVFMVLTSLAFAFLPLGASKWILVPLCLFFGFAAIGWGGIALTLVSEFAGKEAAGTVSAMSSVFVMLGNVVGPPLFGYIVDTSGSYRIAWQFLAAMGLVGMVLLFFVRESRRRI